MKLNPIFTDNKYLLSKKPILKKLDEKANYKNFESFYSEEQFNNLISLDPPY